MVKTHVIRLRGVEGRNTGNQIAFFAFHSFLVEVQTNAEYIHVTSAVASMRPTERLKFKISRGGGGMPLNPPSNSRLPRLAVWSGYGTGDACIITTWRLGLQVTRGTCNNKGDF